MRLTPKQRELVKAGKAIKFTSSSKEQFFITANGQQVNNANGQVYAVSSDGAKFGAFNNLNDCMAFLENF